MKVGIIGSSVSSMMMCVELAKMGIETSILDSDLHGIASSVATEHIAMAVTPESIKKLSLRCDKIICNTKLDFALEEKLHAPIFPNKSVLNEIGNPKNVIEMCELLDIPTMATYYFDTKEQVLEILKDIERPHIVGMEVNGFMHQRTVFSKEEVADLVLDLCEMPATSYMIQPLDDFEYTISCICFTDKKGKLVLYTPISIQFEEENMCILRMGNHITKTMTTRLNRYSRKLMKEIDARGGAFTIRYGVVNKSVKLIDVLPAIGIGSLLTEKGYDVSIFEQYARFVNNMKNFAPNLLGITYARIWQDDEIDPELEGTIYRIDENVMNVRLLEEDE